MNKLRKILTEMDEVHKTVKAFAAYPVETSANCCEVGDSNYEIKNLESRISYLRDELYRLWDAFLEHKEDGHLPEIESVEQMQRILQVLGLDSEYKVEKKTVYASHDGKPTNSWLEIHKK